MKKMRGSVRKIWSITLAIVLTVGLVHLPETTALAAGEPVFSARFTDMEGKTITAAKPGDEVRVVLSVSNAVAVTGFGVDALYDKTKLAEAEGKKGGFTNAFYDYLDAIPRDDFTKINACNAEYKDGMVVIHAVSPNGPSDAMPADIGDMDIAYANLKVVEGFEGDVSVKVKGDGYFLNNELKKRPIAERISATLTVAKPKIPLQDFTLNKETLSLDASGDEPTSKLSVVSYIPENTTDSENKVVWETSNNSVATVSEDGTVTAVGKGTANITAAIANAEGKIIAKTCAVTVTKSVKSITVNPQAVTLKKGQEKQLAVAITPEDADEQSVTWSTSDASTVTVDANGMIKAVAENGTATITAASKNGKTDKCIVTVATKHLQAIALNKTESAVNVGNTEKLTITYNPDLTNVTDEVSEPNWTSSDESIATVAEDGTVTAVGQGKATITAVVISEGKEFAATCNITVNVPIEEMILTPTQIVVLKNETKILNAAVTPTNADIYELEWSISAVGHATIEPSADKKSCKVTGVSEGQIFVTITDKISGKTASATVTVREIPITQVNMTLEKTKLNKGEKVQASAKCEPDNTTDNKTIVWSSDNEEIATVDSTGKITAAGPGTTIIRATSKTRPEICATKEITVSVPLESILIEGSDLELVKNQSADLTVSYKPSDTTVDKSKLVWKVSDKKIISVDNNGKITAKKAGEATVTASLDGKTASKKVTVTEIPLKGIALSEKAKTFDLKDSTFTLTLIQDTEGMGDTTDKIVSTVWESSDDKVADVVNGMVTAKDKGTTEIKVTVTTDAGTIYTDVCKLTVVIPLTGLQIMRGSQDVTETTIELKKGETTDVTAIAVPSNTSDNISNMTWISSNPEAVKVENGKITTLKESEKPVEITAQVTTPSGTIKSTVYVSAIEIHIEAIELSKTELTLEENETKTLTVSYLPENTTDVKAIKSWSSSAPQVASVENGVITAHKGGTAVIVATTANGKTAKCTVTVPIHMESIAAEPMNMRRGDEAQAIAVKVNPENTTDDKTLSYEIRSDSDKGVIELDSENKVVAKKAGKAYVVVTASKAYGEEKPTAVCEVVVTEQHLTDEDLAFSEETAGLHDVDENNIHQVRIDVNNPKVELVCKEDVTDDVYVEYAVKPEYKDIVTVDEDGNMTFLQTGHAVVQMHVTAMNGAGEETYNEVWEYELNVYEVPVTALEFAKDSKDTTVLVGEERTLTVIVTPENTTDKTLIWTSSDPSTATVTSAANGTATVKGLKAGQVTITVGAVNGIQVSTTVKVEEKKTPNITPGDGDKKEPTTENTMNKAVKTGDMAHSVTFKAAFASALFAIFVILKRRYRKTV